MRQLIDDEIKHELVKMLLALVEIFDNYSIKYSIIAGTMLGAVRHGGFIPWDDDIDIIVPRDDYDRLISVIRSDKNMKNKFSSFELNNSIYPFLKFINKNIEIQDPVGLDKFLWIDIFPADNINLQDKKHFRKQYFLFKCYQCKRAINYPILYDEQMVGRSFFKRRRNAIFIFLLRFVPIDKILNRLILNAKKYKNSSNINDVTVLVLGSLEREAFPKSYLDSYIKMPFENIEVSVISHYREWLTIRYGDYMKLPPIEERVNHGICAYIKEENDV